MTIEPMCSFYVRTLVSDTPTYRYERLDNVGKDRYLNTPHPPLIGDLIHLGGGTYRVVDRAWGHSTYGSFNWPLGAKESTVGPLLDFSVESADGLFVN